MWGKYPLNFCMHMQASGFGTYFPEAKEYKRYILKIHGCLRFIGSTPKFYLYYHPLVHLMAFSRKYICKSSVLSYRAIANHSVHAVEI